MTTDSSADENLPSTHTRPLRLPIALGLLLVNLFWLLIAVERYLIPPDAVSEFDTVPNFAERSWDSFLDFAGVVPIVLPVLAVLIVTHLRPVLDAAKPVVLVALVEYGMSALFSIIAFVAAFFYGNTVTGANGQTTAYYTWRNAVEDGFRRLLWLVLLGLAVAFVVKAALPLFRGAPKPDRFAAYGQGGPGFGPGDDGSGTGSGQPRYAQQPSPAQQAAQARYGQPQYAQQPGYGEQHGYPERRGHPQQQGHAQRAGWGQQGYGHQQQVSAPPAGYPVSAPPAGYPVSAPPAGYPVSAPPQQPAAPPAVDRPQRAIPPPAGPQQPAAYQPPAPPASQPAAPQQQYGWPPTPASAAPAPPVSGPPAEATQPHPGAWQQVQPAPPAQPATPPPAPPVSTPPPAQPVSTPPASGWPTAGSHTAPPPVADDESQHTQVLPPDDPRLQRPR